MNAFEISLIVLYLNRIPQPANILNIYLPSLLVLNVFSAFTIFLGILLLEIDKDGREKNLKAFAFVKDYNSVLPNWFVVAVEFVYVAAYSMLSWYWLALTVLLTLVASRILKYFANQLKETVIKFEKEQS
jgi:hypothetical protein